jgi:hypothetical protein
VPASGAVVLDAEDQAARLARLACVGMSSTPLGTGLLPGICARVLADGGIPLVVSDAVVMPWTPYAHRMSVEHSMVITAVDEVAGVATFTDGYDNRTEWGDAVPMDGALEGSILAAVETAPGARVVAVHRLASARDAGPDRVALLQEVATTLSTWMSAEVPEAFDALSTRAQASAGDAGAFAEFCQDCWTIERRRALFGRWLHDVADDAGPLLPGGFADRFAGEVVARWAMVNRFAYLALRRLRAGHPADGRRLGEAVRAAGHAEAALAGLLAGAVTGAAR